jgi:hypothetical protein
MAVEHVSLRLLYLILIRLGSWLVPLGRSSASSGIAAW